jgi:hypothetical protein
MFSPFFPPVGCRTSRLKENAAFLTKSAFLPSFSGSCSETEVSGQLEYIIQGFYFVNRACPKTNWLRVTRTVWENLGMDFFKKLYPECRIRDPFPCRASGPYIKNMALCRV